MTVEDGRRPRCPARRRAPRAARPPHGGAGPGVRRRACRGRQRARPRRLGAAPGGAVLRRPSRRRRRRPGVVPRWCRTTGRRLPSGPCRSQCLPGTRRRCWTRARPSPPTAARVARGPCGSGAGSCPVPGSPPTTRTWPTMCCSTGQRSRSGARRMRRRRSPPRPHRPDRLPTQPRHVDQLRRDRPGRHPTCRAAHGDAVAPAFLRPCRGRRPEPARTLGHAHPCGTCSGSSPSGWTCASTVRTCCVR